MIEKGKAGYVSTHSRPKAAGCEETGESFVLAVSTHSRPKAAGYQSVNWLSVTHLFQHTAARRRLERAHSRSAPPPSFNTQPPEGGWVHSISSATLHCSFQHTAARRRLDLFLHGIHPVSVFQHTAARRRLVKMSNISFCVSMFQHTAARRRLDDPFLLNAFAADVSTHSRPKAAGLKLSLLFFIYYSFNTQPPEGGWAREAAKVGYLHCFNTQPPEGGWLAVIAYNLIKTGFQHTAARRRLGTNRLNIDNHVLFQHTAA